MCNFITSKYIGDIYLWFIFTARKRSLGQGNIFTPVCHSVHGGEYLTRYTTPRPGTPSHTRYTPRPGTPPDQVHPQTRYTPGPGTSPRTGTPPSPQDQGDTVHARAVRILLECNLAEICVQLNYPQPYQICICEFPG